MYVCICVSVVWFVGRDCFFAWVWNILGFEKKKS